MTTSPIISERIDDIPLLMRWILDMQIDQMIDGALGAAHGNRQGLSQGQVAVVFIAYVLSECNHFLSPVRGWVSKHHHVLSQLLGSPIGETDFTDDRLEDLLDAVGQDEIGELLEERLSQHLICAYELPTETARIDTTTVSVYHQNNESKLLDYGQSKDHRPDLRQFKEVLSTLDPVGIPLCSATVAGHCADDPLYLPIWQRLVKVIGRPDFLVVGDCKLASLANRAQIQDGGGYYLAPLPMTGKNPDELCAWVLNPPVPVCDICLPNESEPVGKGFEVAVAQCWTYPKTTDSTVSELASTNSGTVEETSASRVTWSERTFVLRSDKLARRQQHGLSERLKRAEQALRKLKTTAQSDLAQLTAQSQALLERHNVVSYLLVTWSAHTFETKRYLKRGRRGPNSPFETLTNTTWLVTVTPLTDAIARFDTLAGWRLFVSNSPTERLNLQSVVSCYREEWQPERGFHRLKGAALAIRPLFLRSDQRICGLLRILVIALRTLTLLEFVARRHLTQDSAPVKGLYPGNPQRATLRPTAERLLRAFDNISWYQVSNSNSVWQLVTPLSDLQRQILLLLGLSETLYTQLATPSLARTPL